MATPKSKVVAAPKLIPAGKAGRHRIAFRTVQLESVRRLFVTLDKSYKAGTLKPISTSIKPITRAVRVKSA